jgi:uncharacterized protein
MKIDSGAKVGRGLQLCPPATVVCLLALALLAAACAPQREVGTAPEPATSAPMNPIATPLATLPDGASVELELALTADEISRGLMFRPSLPANRGMLFLFEETRYPTFWMKNTLVALDMVFLDEVGGVVQVEADAQPCAAEPCPQYTTRRPARAVLELPAGSARRHGLAEGSSIRFVAVPGYPLRQATP